MHKYKGISKKGEGTFSEVIKAKCIKTSKLVAIKKMKNHFDSIEQVNNLREIQAIKRLSPHPNIIKLYEVLYDQPTGRLALVFELMDMNIYELIRNRKHYLPEGKIKNYMYQLLKAIDHMHKNGIFHRDIKPENILIVDDVLKVADFGSCRGIYSKQPYTEYISTRWYRAPECLLTDGYYNYKMDIWGVGCVFFEVVSLFPLFPGTNELDQINKIHNIIGTPEPELLAKMRKHSTHMNFNFPPKVGTGIEKLIPHASPECIELIKKMLAYNPDERITARQALRHPYFKELRDAEKRAKRSKPASPNLLLSPTNQSAPNGASSSANGNADEDDDDKQFPMIQSPSSKSAKSKEGDSSANADANDDSESDISLPRIRSNQTNYDDKSQTNGNVNNNYNNANNNSNNNNRNALDNVNKSFEKADNKNLNAGIAVNLANNNTNNNYNAPSNAVANAGGANGNKLPAVLVTNVSNVAGGATGGPQKVVSTNTTGLPVLKKFPGIKYGGWKGANAGAEVTGPLVVPGAAALGGSAAQLAKIPSAKVEAANVQQYQFQYTNPALKDKPPAPTIKPKKSKPRMEGGMVPTLSTLAVAPMLKPLPPKINDQPLLDALSRKS